MKGMESRLKLRGQFGNWDSPNEFTKSIHLENAAEGKKFVSNKGDEYATHIIKYVSCTEVDIDRQISVGIHIPGIGNFDTTSMGTNTNNAPPGQHGNPYIGPMYLRFITIPQINYHKYDLWSYPSYENNWQKKSIDYYLDGSPEYSREYDCFYDSYYYTLPNEIKKVDIHGVGEGSIVSLTNRNRNQHIMAVHPFWTGMQIDKVGLERWIHYGSYSAYFDLFQNVTFNYHSNALYITHMTFCTDDAWNSIDGDIGHLFYSIWFTIYDSYGNSGKFRPIFADNFERIEIDDKY